MPMTTACLRAGNTIHSLCRWKAATANAMKATSTPIAKTQFLLLAKNLQRHCACSAIHGMFSTARELIAGAGLGKTLPNRMAQVFYALIEVVLAPKMV